MACLSMHLLGGFQVELDGEPITGFKSDKVRALLAFLAVEAEQPHPRDLLAWLLWPDSPNRAARTNLRSILANLRQVIREPAACPPHLIISRQAIQFNRAGEHWLDVSALAAASSESGIDRSQVRCLEVVARLYRGPFLSGFSIGDSGPFEDWLLLTREQIIRRVMSALSHLATYYELRAEYEEAQAHAWKMVEIEPEIEEAHQQLMRVLALGGQRSAAMLHYEACRKVLSRELGMEPSHDTTLLYEAIRDERLGTFLAAGGAHGVAGGRGA